MKRSAITILLAIMITALFSACSQVNSNGNSDVLSASGTIAAKDISVAPEIGGKVVEVLVEEGDIVSAGDVLLRVDDELLDAQYTQVATSVDAARATVEAAKAQLASAEIQHELVLQGARMQEIETRTTAWSAASSDDIDLPTWYYEKDERIAALETEVQTAQVYLEEQLVHLE
ncbi:MAG: biotin/lipoyl-binding protein, partial [Anaerolineaceae bacterium]|nr:biotin/lipoyl-binding protein [Anaerolineaceae bacterium]